MKRLLLALLILGASLPAYGQGSPLCYTTNGSNCIKVGTTPASGSAWGPLPVTISGNSVSLTQGGNTAGVSIDGNLSVNTPPASQFFDAFSSTLDTTTNWTTNNSTGTAITSAGTLTISSSTVASARGGLSSKQSWAPQGISLQVYGVWVSFANTTIANSSRVFGMFTVPGSPSITVPVTDGYVWRLDGTGSLFAEIWATGVAISSTNVTTACPITNGVANTYAIYYRTGLTQFYCGATLAATVGFYSPANQTLPTSAFSIAGSTPPLSSATMALGGLTLATYSPAGGSKAAGQAPTVNDPAQVVSLSPNSPGITASLAIVGKTTTEAKVTIAVTNTYQQALAASAPRTGCTIQYIAVAGSKGYVFFGSAPADTTTSFQLTNGQSINCAIGGIAVATDAVQVTGTGTDIFVVSNQ